MKIRICLLLDESTQQIVKEYSQLLSSTFPTLFTIDDTHIPHVTLTHIEIDENKFEQLRDTVESVLMEFPSLQTEVADSRVDDMTYLGVYFSSEDTIITLRDLVAGTVASIINNASSFRSPHITITRMEDEHDVTKAMEALKTFPQITVPFRSVAICDSQENGTISKVIFTLPLSK